MARQLPFGFIQPCLPTVGRTVPAGPVWVHEIKHDGYRMICRRAGDRVRIFSRRGLDWTERVPRIAVALEQLRVTSATIDGEAVICDEDGVADFERLRKDLARRLIGSQEVFLYAFDLLELDGCDLRSETWDKRRRALTRLLARVRDGIALSEHLESEHGPAMFREACARGLEGIVSKRRDRPYRSGKCPDWVKVKNPHAPAASRIMEF